MTADYHVKREDRIERLRAKADKAQRLAESAMARARRMADVIPFGQPVLIGHHSEKRDRNYRARIDRTYRRAFDLEATAKHYRERAKAAEANKAISSDNPDAVTELTDKLDRLHARQTKMKAANAAWRKAGRPSFPDRDWGQNEAPHAPYELSNLSGNIRRIKERIKQLEQAATAETVEEDHGLVKLVENVDENRVQLIFPGKPDEDTRGLLKSFGFRWSPTNGAWQRHLDNAGRAAAGAIVNRLAGAALSV